MALIQTIGERTYTYSHCVGSLFAFTAPTDLVLGAKGVVYSPSLGCADCLPYFAFAPAALSRIAFARASNGAAPSLR